MEDNGPIIDHYSQRRNGDHHQYAYQNGTSHGGSRRESDIFEDDGAVHISHRISGINFTPTLHDSLVNEIRKLRNKLDKRENEVKLLNEELDVLRESHDNLQETHDALASSSSKDIRSLRTQLERNAAAHVSEVKALRLELQETTSAVQDLRGKLDTTRRAKSQAEEQRDKWKSELDDLKSQNNNAKVDLERRLGRETEKVKVLEDLVQKMESEIERSTLSVKSGSDRMSLDIPQESDEEEDEEAPSPNTKHAEPSSPIQTLFAEMAGMEPDEPESEDEVEEPTGRYSAVQSPELAVNVPNVHVAKVLQSLRAAPDVETVDRAVQTEKPQAPTIIPLIRVLSPTPPLTNAPYFDFDDVEMYNVWTQTELETCSQAVQTDTPDVLTPLPASLSPTIKSAILRPQNSLRRSSHSVRWQDDKSIQTEVEPIISVEIGIQTDPFILAKQLKPALKTPTSETKEPDKVRLERVKSYDGPKRERVYAAAKVTPTSRVEGVKGGSSVLGNGSVTGHTRTGSDRDKRIASARSSILLAGQHARRLSSSLSHSEPRRGRQPYPNWVKSREKKDGSSSASGPQLHTPTKQPSNVPPLPIPQRSSSKFRVVLPIIRDRPAKEKEEALPGVQEEADDIQESDDDDRARREISAFLARPPRRTVRQIRSAVNLRPSTAGDLPPPTPDHFGGSQNSLNSHTPSQSPLELAQKSYSTPRKQPKRLVKLRPPPPPREETIACTLSPSSSNFPTQEEMTVVDEIAKCMVGEYMYKYVRRRRRGSFTWRRSPARQPNYAEDVEESTIRHKRWVWLQPYEKMIMWSSTQPSQSNFLQRAQVKKRVVTNVLDVRDDAPLISPSGTTLQTPAHNRSIVVLTPTQAIKFTALSRERHISWLTALNFLVHNDPTDLIIPRGLSTSPSNNSLWAREPMYPASATATTNSITSSQGTPQPPFPGASLHPPFGSYTVRKNSLPDFAPRLRDDVSPLGYKTGVNETYATPPSVPRIPTGRRFEGGRERSGSGSAQRDWDDPSWLGETIRMDAFVRKSPPRLELDIDNSLFQNF